MKITSSVNVTKALKYDMVSTKPKKTANQTWKVYFFSYSRKGVYIWEILANISVK
jgi:hypothetical protein